MNKHDEIKKFLNVTRNYFEKNNTLLKEDIRKIKKKYGINEDDEIDNTGEDIAKRINVPSSVETEIEFEENPKKDKQQSYRISGGIITTHGKSQKDLQLTSLEKTSFQETMDEFVNEVSDMVDFEKLNLYENNIDWSGKLIEFDMSFMFRIGETNGVYIDCEMIKVDEDFKELVEKLSSYYEKFKSKWAKVLAQRKKTHDE